VAAVERLRGGWTASRALYRRRWWVRSLTNLGIYLFVWFGVLPFLASTVAYPMLAPDGWTNASVHTRANPRYAVSSDVSGLMLACGSHYSVIPHISHSHLTFTDPGVYFWRTRDGGARWHVIRAPFTNEDCRLAAPRSGPNIFFALAPSADFRSSKPEPLWVTHDAGTTWRFVTSIPNKASVEDDTVTALQDGVYRDGRLYALLPPTDQSQHTPLTFSVSEDDGATWAAPEATPSALEQQDWNVESFAADYSMPHAWYRVLSKSGGTAVALERSADDGQHWISAGPIGTVGAVGVTIATTLAQPLRLCIAADSPLLLANSSDAGRSWHESFLPPSFQDTSGYPPSPVRIGSDGACYYGYIYQKGVPPQSGPAPDKDYNGALFELTPGQTQMGLMSLPGDYVFESGWIPGSTLTYVPAGDGMSARVVIYADNFSLGVPYFLAALGGESGDEFLLWRPAP
jgi:hypothetical protein